MKRPIAAFLIIFVALIVYFLATDRSDHNIQSSASPETSQTSDISLSKEDRFRAKEDGSDSKPDGQALSSVTMTDESQAVPRTLKPQESVQSAKTMTVDRIDSSQIQTLTRIAWETSGEHDPKEAAYDDFMQTRAKSIIGNQESWGEYKKRSGVYSGVLIALSDQMPRPFHALIRWTDSPSVLWLSWQHEDRETTPVYIGSFTSPFSASEIYGRSLHAPLTAFEGVLYGDETDKEILILSGVQNGSDGKTMDSFNGRVYLRSGLALLKPVGQVSFQFESNE